MLLTRLPVARFVVLGKPPDLARCVWAFPVVGLVVNGVGGFVYWMGYRVGMSPLLAAAWALAATMVITGAFHEDGLADTADGFGGGTTRARKLEIMRDSCIGSYGTLALLLSITIRVAAIATLGHPRAVLMAMTLAGMLGRNGILLLLLSLPAARNDGMTASIGKLRASNVMLGFALAIVASFLLLPTLLAIAAVVLAFGSSFALAKLAAKQIGGYTGDVLGASEVAAECVVLTVIASLLAR